MDRSTAGEPVQPSLDGTIETWPGAPEGGWDRVLLKLSGEAFSGGGGLGVVPMWWRPSHGKSLMSFVRAPK